MVKLDTKENVCCTAVTTTVAILALAALIKYIAPLSINVSIDACAPNVTIFPKFLLSFQWLIVSAAVDTPTFYEGIMLQIYTFYELN